MTPVPLRELPHFQGPLWLQTGPNARQGKFVAIGGMSTRHLGGRFGDLADLIDVRHPRGESISVQLEFIGHAIPYVTQERARLGAIQNRLEFTIQSTEISSENLQNSQSRIRGADMAREMMDFLQMSTLFQAGMAMLAQANQLPHMITQLLQN